MLKETEINISCSAGPPCAYFTSGEGCDFWGICVYQRPLDAKTACADLKMQDSLEVMQSKVAVFNQRFPVGSSVTVIKDLGEQVETKVKWPAAVLSGHTPVVWLDGISGCYLLDRVGPTCGAFNGLRQWRC